MNDWQKLIEEYKAHNGMLQEMLKEKNKEIRRYREAIEKVLYDDIPGWSSQDVLGKVMDILQETLKNDKG